MRANGIRASRRRQRVGDVGPDAAFDLVVRFGGRKLPMHYETAAFDAAAAPRRAPGEQPAFRLARHDHRHPCRPAARACTTTPRSTCAARPGCSTGCCSCSSIVRATRRPRACARRSTGERPWPRRWGTRGIGRRELHAHRLRRTPAPVRLDAARPAPPRRPDGDRHGRDVGARAGDRAACSPPSARASASWGATRSAPRALGGH